jgi:hypothetical protein
MGIMLGNLSSPEVSMIVDKRFGNSPMPYLRDPAVRERSIRVAREQGLIDRVQRELEIGRGEALGNIPAFGATGPCVQGAGGLSPWRTARDIPVISHSLFRRFRRTGNRSDCEKLIFWRDRQIELAALACYLGLDQWEWLCDLLWAECETTWWELPAHEAHSHPIDLFAAVKAKQLATVLAALGERIDPEVRTRVKAEIRRRILDPFLDPAQQDFFWKTVNHNWNPVCHGGVGLAAMLIEEDRYRLDRTIRMILRDLEVFLDGFAPDGGCTEGPGYWRFGFGWYVALAAGLYDFSGGKINLMAGERIERICRYPLAVAIRPGVELEFADAHSEFISPETAILINRFVPVPELFGMCRLTKDGALAVENLTDLVLYDGTKYSPADLSADAWLKDLGVVKACRGEVAVGAKGGHNAEHHNHNDVGSFAVYRGGTAFLCDPGAPVYSARTFSEKRYESVYVNSFGHSVPVIEGQGQGFGRQFAGTIVAEGLGDLILSAVTCNPGASASAGCHTPPHVENARVVHQEARQPTARATKRITIEMGGAYPVPTMKKLTRTIELPAGGQEVAVADSYEFSQPPASLQEAFITTLPAEVTPGGRTVVLRSKSDGVARLTAQAGGRFAVVELTEESKAESHTGELLRRILFTPAKLAARMDLGFVVRFE